MQAAPGRHRAEGASLPDHPMMNGPRGDYPRGPFTTMHVTTRHRGKTGPLAGINVLAAGR